MRLGHTHDADDAASTHVDGQPTVAPAHDDSNPDVETGRRERVYRGLFSRAHSFNVGATAPESHNSEASPVQPSANASPIIPEEDGEKHGKSTTVMSYVAKRARAFSNAFTRATPTMNDEETERAKLEAERARYDQQVIDLLDVIDPEVSTLTTLGDLQNSLFVPDLGRFVDRSQYLKFTKPVHELPPDQLPDMSVAEKKPSIRSRFGRKKKKLEPIQEDAVSRQNTRSRYGSDQTLDGGQPSPVARGKFLILPNGLVDWDSWSPEEREELDDYVRHLLHSRKWRLRRGLRGFKHYVSTPLGAFVTIYASLLTFWGAAWVLFLIGWLNAGHRQDYFVEICDQILTALFCVVGIGLAPFRAVDTYHMIYIARLHRKSLRLYKERGEERLPDENDLPDPGHRGRESEFVKPVLSVREQALLMYHQRKFSKSHTFYKPHETPTHKAFPLKLLIIVVSLLDFHSLFQMALGSTTWSISYHKNYKRILTTIILSFSLTCNITAGLIIATGNRRTRKTEVLEARLRESVTEEAVRRKAAKAERERDEAAERAREEQAHRVKHARKGISMDDPAERERHLAKEEKHAQMEREYKLKQERHAKEGLKYVSTEDERRAASSGSGDGGDEKLSTKDKITKKLNRQT